MTNSPPLDMDSLKKHLQSFFSDGLVVIVGSGLSCAEGLPSMGELSKQLLDNIDSSEISGDTLALWNNIASKLKDGTDLESVLLEHSPDETLQNRMSQIIAETIILKEMNVCLKVIQDGYNLPFTSLLKHVPFPTRGLPVITTNYDRLLEVAIESTGILVNTLFTRGTIGLFDPQQACCEMLSNMRKRGKIPVLEYMQNVLLLKPHGSINWFFEPNSQKPLRTDLTVSLSRLIIPPGANKFRDGYNVPFDKHREEANKRIDEATKLLIIGYGFNDSHLETHLRAKILSTPTLLITKSLSEQTGKLIADNSTMTAVVESSQQDKTTIWQNGTSFDVDLQGIWKIDQFVQEILTS